CRGAFGDVSWIWRNAPKLGPDSILRLDGPAPPEGIESFPDQGVPALSSPVQCLWLLAVLSALCAAAALLLPAVRTVLRGTLYPRNLVMLSPVEQGDPDVQNGLFDPYPSVARAQFESLKASEGGQFTGLAFYALARMPVE